MKRALEYLGPGVIIAATGVGAGDMVAATVAGANYGTTIFWAIVVGAVFKFVLNEGISRWQLSTNTSILSAWVDKFHPFISYYFIAYLFVWSFMVAGALMSACGLAAHSIFPVLSVQSWGIIHSIIAVVLILVGRYTILENIMKVFICLMFVTIVSNLFIADMDWRSILSSFWSPALPPGSVKFIVGVIGGVGGSVTLLCYGYWLNEKGWKNIDYLKRSRIDLSIAYLFTGFFGLGVVVLSSELNPDKMMGNQIVIGLANKIMETTGSAGKWVFLIGFWGAVFSSMLGVWSGVPYIFNEFMVIKENKLKNGRSDYGIRSKYYKIFLLFLAIPPICLLFLEKPVWIIIIYSIAGAFFMPFLAATLLYLNNQVKWVTQSKNGLITNLILLCTLVLFLYLFATKLF